jgi:hypothetical protein
MTTQPPTTEAYDGDPRSGATLLVGFIGAILFLAVSVFGLVLFLNAQRREELTKDYAEPPRELLELQMQQRLPLAEYSVIDPQNQVYGLPIERAMELVVQRGATTSAPASRKSTSAPTTMPTGPVGAPPRPAGTQP